MGDVGEVVLVHGAWSRGEQWCAAAKEFAQRGFRVHTPTLRHHDLSLDDGAAKIAQLSQNHPAWYHNLRAHPDCELPIGPRGGAFTAREILGPERDRLFQLASDRLTPVYDIESQRSVHRTVPVMRLTPSLVSTSPDHER